MVVAPNVVLLALICGGGAVLASAGTPNEVAPAALDDPCTDVGCARRALDGFRAALTAQREHAGPHPLRVSFFGDSVTADDHITGILRQKLGAIVGEGGPGFVFAIEPHKFNQNHSLRRMVGGTWRVAGLSTTPAPDRLLGLGGSAESEGAGGSIRLVAATPVSSVDVHYLAQPRGGSLAVLADGNVISTIATATDDKRGDFARIALPAATANVELRATGRVRLFGASLEAKAGAVVDNLGIVSATAKQMITRNLRDHLRNQLAHRASDLVIVMLGTNEAGWLSPRGSGMAEHERLFGELLASVRAANPRGSCLVISPLEQTDWRTEGLPARASVPAMVAAQHRAATANGCAFWDAYAWMGGEGASKQWLKRGWLRNDYAHPTPAGATRIANALFAALVP